jgi:thioesterase domain-containing protein
MQVSETDDILLCIPGAGASITSFMGFIENVGRRWTIYGLQPRGVDSVECPDATVDGAARRFLGSVMSLPVNSRIHIIGHSYGGLVGFELATRLVARGRTVDSTTLIDSESPAGRIPIRNETEIRKSFVIALAHYFEITLSIRDDFVEDGSEEKFLGSIHRELCRTKCVSTSTKPEMLKGSLATFSAAARADYMPTSFYRGVVHLALVRELGLSFAEDALRRNRIAADWRLHGNSINAWHGPGDHYSILKWPHVKSLAQWWTEERRGDRCIAASLG